jgi:hypothetical protein
VFVLHADENLEMSERAIREEAILRILPAVEELNGRANRVPFAFPLRDLQTHSQHLVRIGPKLRFSA